jgi:hypothetical protein
MAVRSISRNAVEMTADGDVWLDVVRADSILATTNGAGGEIVLTTNIIKLTDVHGALFEKDAAALATDEAVYWRSGAMNAGEARESAISLGDAYGLRLSAPAGGRVVIYIN